MSDDLETIVNAFRLLDADTYEEALALIDDEFEMITPAAIASEPDTYRGPDGMRRWWESFLEVMEWVRFEIEGVHPVGDGRLILEFVIHTRGRASGIETDQRAVGLGSARNGKVYRLALFSTVDEARAAAHHS